VQELRRREESNDVLVPEHYKRMKRGPQVMLPKDIGIVIAYSGVGKESFCIDGGTGSGWLAVSLARICKRVVTYDRRKDFIAIAKKNAEREGLENIEFKEGDVIERIDERDADLVALDIPDSQRAIRNSWGALREGGSIFGYLPHTEQVAAFVEELGAVGFSDIITLEVIVRDMLVRKEGTRPSTKGVWHTGYLVFARKKEGLSAVGQ
jgi:tRNA (adenine57-N1/adenine58-N1)-methyltransferase